MKLICFLSDQTFNPEIPAPDRGGYDVRTAARAILENSQGEIALLHVGGKGIYKIPGGGIESGEDKHQALQREILEETGCHSVVGQEFGVTIEFRDQWHLTQISYCFTAKMLGETSTPDFTEEEIADGFEIRWIPKDKVLEIMESLPKSTNYDGQFMQPRDLAILRAYLNQDQPPVDL